MAEAVSIILDVFVNNQMKWSVYFRNTNVDSENVCYINNIYSLGNNDFTFLSN